MKKGEETFFPRYNDFFNLDPWTLKQVDGRLKKAHEINLSPFGVRACVRVYAYTICV